MKATKNQIEIVNRLSSQAVFDSLRQARDTRWVASAIIVQARPAPENPGYGLCVSASRRTSAKAVERNRMRRRLKAVALDVLPRCAQPGMDYMITCRQQALTQDYAGLERDLRWCLKKLNLLKMTGSGDSHAG